MKLDEYDRRLLAALGSRPQRVEALAARLGSPAPALRMRLVELAENGLVYDLGGGRFQRTESGRRVHARATGVLDDRIDTTPGVERALAGFALTAEAAAAVRAAFAFLRYWGRATEDEIIDAIYSERPSGFTTAEAWWEHVREPLAALPDVAAPTGSDGEWRYTGAAEVNAPLSDGLRVFTRRGRPPFASVKHALESLDLSPVERDAVRAAFAVLRRRGEASEAAIAAAVYPAHSAGYESPEAWWDGLVRDAFSALPGVSPAETTGWCYRQPVRRREPTLHTEREP